MKKRTNYIFNSVDTEKVDKLQPFQNLITTRFISAKTFKKHKSGLGKKARKNRNRKVIRSYKSYMLSNLWVNRKNRYWQEHGRFCVACGGTFKVTLHHAFYSGCYGQEPDTDVFALCQGCHSRFHKTYKLQKDMRKDTNIFIDEIQGEIYSSHFK